MRESVHRSKQKETLVQNGKSEAKTTGIPNSALEAVMAGKAKASSEMMGHRQDLAPSLAAKMSKAFGMDLSRVQLYRTGAMEGTETKGMASGNKIVLSKDIDLNTMAGQAVLGHEISHVRAQSQGIGMGHSGLYKNSALEQQADTEGMLAAHGQSILGESTGMDTGLGMGGIGGLTPLGPGMSASAGAPMQAGKFTWPWSKKEQPAAAKQPASAPQEREVVFNDEVEIDEATFEQINKIRRKDKGGISAMDHVDKLMNNNVPESTKPEQKAENPSIDADIHNIPPKQIINNNIIDDNQSENGIPEDLIIRRTNPEEEKNKGYKFLLDEEDEINQNPKPDTKKLNKKANSSDLYDPNWGTTDQQPIWSDKKLEIEVKNLLKSAGFKGNSKKDPTFWGQMCKSTEVKNENGDDVPLSMRSFLNAASLSTVDVNKQKKIKNWMKEKRGDVKVGGSTMTRLTNDLADDKNVSRGWKDKDLRGIIETLAQGEPGKDELDTDEGKKRVQEYRDAIKELQKMRYAQMKRMEEKFGHIFEYLDERSLYNEAPKKEVISELKAGQSLVEIMNGSSYTKIDLGSDEKNEDYSKLTEYFNKVSDMLAAASDHMEMDGYGFVQHGFKMDNEFKNLGRESSLWKEFQNNLKGLHGNINSNKDMTPEQENWYKEYMKREYGME